MSESVETAPLPSLPYRARPPQVLLGVGAVLLVSAGAAVASEYGGGPVRLLLAPAVAAIALSLWTARQELRSSAETLAACAVGLGVVGTSTARGLLSGSVLTAAGLGLLFAALAVAARSTLTWPLASWGLGQLAVLRILSDLPEQLRTEVLFGVALAGLGLALFGRLRVARVALVTTVPWWVAGTADGSAEAWAGSVAERWLAAVLMTGAAGGLLLIRRREALHPLLGPRQALPVLAGVVAGAGLTGAAVGTGIPVVTGIGFAGVVVASWADATLHGDRRTAWLPVALAAGYTAALLTVLRLVSDEHWTALTVLLFLTAAPTVYAAWRHPDDRPVTVPVAVGCAAAGVLSAVPAGWWPVPVAAALLTAVYAAALGVGAAFPAGVRRGTVVTAALCCLATVTVLTATDHRPVLALLMAVQATATLSWAWRTSDDARGEAAADEAADTAAAASSAWRIGAAQLVLAVWTGVAHAGWSVLEAYTVPAAVGLAIAAGSGLRRVPSWRSEGPPLLVLFVPSTLLAVVQPHGVRAVVILVLAALAMGAGARRIRRAPLLVGAWSALAVGLGLAVRALPWPVGVALVVGALLLWWGAVRERNPVDGFGRRLADLR